MKIVVTVPARDLEQLIARSVPFDFEFGGPEGEKVLSLEQLLSLELVPGEGIRLEMNGRITWPLLGIEVPLRIEPVRVLVRLTRELRPSGTLVVRLNVEHANLVWVPDAFDKSVVERVNEEIRGRRLEAAWDFERLLNHRFALPAALRSSDLFSLLVQESELDITPSELRLETVLSASLRRRAAEP